MQRHTVGKADAAPDGEAVGEARYLHGQFRERLLYRVGGVDSRVIDG